MKFPLLWHKDCLANMRGSAERMKVEVQSMQERYERLLSEINAYDAQIIEAELRGVDEFDSDKFGIKRKK